MEHADVFTAVLNSVTDYAIVLLDPGGLVVRWNCGAELLLGLTKLAGGIHGSSMETLASKQMQVAEKELSEALLAEKISFSRCHRRMDATEFWAEGTLSAMYDTAGSHIGFLKIFTDATANREFQKDLIHDATHDRLTGLANRTAFADHIAGRITSAHRNGGLVVLHLIDLDYFKQVNDTLGHVAGDLLLTQVGERLKLCTRESDCVARMGGDEFAVLQSGAKSSVAAGDLANKIVEAINRPFELYGNQIRIAASIGIAVMPNDASTSDELYRRADAALYRTKHDGRNGFSLFTSQLDKEAHDRTADIAAVRTACATKQFHLVYQPKICASSSQVVAVEALLRCDHLRLTERPIEDVLGLVRDCGLLPDMSEWIVRNACVDASAWSMEGGAAIKVCVNLSARELSELRILTSIDEALRISGLAAENLVIELTEQVLFDSDQTGVAILAALSERGISIALDDFGTGFSSLNYLTTLPISFVKLDISLIKTLSYNDASRDVVKAIIDLAHRLGMQVVAEGVESVTQRALLTHDQCDELQGFLFGQPLDARRFSEWLENYPGVSHP